ncbi:MAG TPA: LytTR family transcriptional regulator DNA-binding domain-containing protein [Thermoanaerobaculia bacterium]|nr:LytTR family transcriptional regulator DNA-binding domain-containing protein [Thermoanaerobaculia bacterium]
MTIRTVLIDDEVPALEGLSAMLGRHDDFEVVGRFASAPEAARMLGRLSPDAVFVDIQMPVLSGFDVVSRLPSERSAVVFVTAHAEFAATAFDIQAIDYLLKPVDQDRFDRSIQRIREHVRSENGETTYAQYLAVRTINRITLVAAREVEWIEAAGNYVRLHTAARNHLLRDSLANLMARLDPSTFVRVHRSSAVNINCIRHIDSTFGSAGVITLHDGTRVAMSEQYRAELVARF